MKNKMKVLKAIHNNNFYITKGKYYICTSETIEYYYIDLKKYDYGCDQAIKKQSKWFIETNINYNIWKILYV